MNTIIPIHIYCFSCGRACTVVNNSNERDEVKIAILPCDCKVVKGEKD